MLSVLVVFYKVFFKGLVVALGLFCLSQVFLVAYNHRLLDFFSDILVTTGLIVFLNSILRKGNNVYRVLNTLRFGLLIFAFLVLIGGWITSFNFTSEGSENILKYLNVYAYINETSCVQLMVLLSYFSLSKPFLIRLMYWTVVIMVTILMSKLGFTLAFVLVLILSSFLRNDRLIKFVLLAFPVIVLFSSFNFLEQLDDLLAYRGSIWAQSFFDWKVNIGTKLFGLGKDYGPILPVPFSSGLYQKWSIHSGIIRVLICYGILGYYAIIIGLGLISKSLKLCESSFYPKILLIFVLTKITDGSVFYGTTSFFEIILVILIINSNVRKETNEKNICASG